VPNNRFGARISVPRSMSSKFRMLPLLLALGLFVPLAFGEPHTPKPGSPERKAICDAMRPYVAKNKSRPLPQPIVFKIEFLRVEGDYAGFEGIPIFADGSDAIPEYLPDIVITTILRRTGAGWQIIADLSRTDVPSEEELVGIRKSIPAEVPRGVLPEFWRKILRR